MKKVNVLQIILELIVIVGSLVLGGTILAYHIIESPITRTLVGLIILCIGTIGLTEFITLRLEVKLKNIQSLVLYIISVILGIVLTLVKIEGKYVCVIWGIYGLCFTSARIMTSFLTLLKQPLLNVVRILSNTVAIIFSIVLLINTVDFVKAYFLFTGIILLIEGLILIVEFIIHRYQN